MIKVQAPATAPVRTVRGWSVWLLRASTVLVTVFVLLQPVLAGLFVTGDVGMLGLHSLNANVILLLVLIQLVAAFLVWRPGGGAVWPIWTSLAYLLLIEAQAGFGYARLVAVHIPFGVALFGLAVALLLGTWSPRIWMSRSASKREMGVR